MSQFSYLQNFVSSARHVDSFPQCFFYSNHTRDDPLTPSKSLSVEEKSAQIHLCAKYLFFPVCDEEMENGVKRVEIKT